MRCIFFSETASFLEGVLYLWSHVTDANTNASGNENANFSRDDYAMLNYLGGVASSGVAAPNDPGNIPNGYIASGQSFFVIGNKSHATSGAAYYNETVFTNAMRAVANNDQFFRGSNSNRSANKMWINLTSDNGVFNQSLIGYVTGASDSVDPMAFDAVKNLSTGSSAFIYTRIAESDKKYAIQGKSPEDLNRDEIISLGFKTSITVPTLYNISIAQLEGNFLSDNPIYIKDNDLNTIHNLKESNYSFTSEVGEFNNRFEIVFTANALSIKDHQLQPNQLTITEFSNGAVQFRINDNFSIAKVDLLDCLGRHIYSLTGSSSREVYTLSKLSKAPYIAKVTLSSGQTITKKAVKQY